MSTNRREHLLVPIDDSSVARRAVERVVRRHPGAEVTLLHVAAVPPRLLEHPGAEDPEEEDRLEERVAGQQARHQRAMEEEGYDALFAPMERHLAEAGIRVKRKVVTEAHPDPAHAIVQEVRADDYDGVVMGRHARSKVGEWLFSSVADEVRHELGSARVTIVD